MNPSAPHHSNPSILHVAVPNPLRKLFDYLPPKTASSAALRPGMRLLVPFGKQRLVGLIIKIDDQSSFPVEALKRSLKILDTEPALSDSLFKLCEWAMRYYQHPPGEVFLQALPTALRQAENDLFANETFWRATHKGKLIDLAQLNRAYRQKAALEQLRKHEHGLSKVMMAGLNISAGTLKELTQKGLLECYQAENKTAAQPAAQILAEPALLANDEQRAAISAINKAQGFQCFLLFGVTGSGKTEVYFQAITQVLERDQQALILVPEISLTPQTLNRFKQRFLTPISVLHSGLTDKQRLQAWRKAHQGHSAIVLGTRSALFTPLPRLGLIIVDEEHDSSYKQQDGFRYSARDLAIYRARLENIPIVLGSATPSLESLHNANQGRYQLLPLWQRAGAAKPPQMQLLDLKKASAQHGVSEPVQQAIAKTLQQGQQVLMFINRRGYAPVLMCHDCGWHAQCQRCDARMTYHRQQQKLHCHHCDWQMPIPKYCPNCNSSDLRSIGQGTERLEDSLTEQFPRTKIIRIDRDTTRRKQALEQHLAHVHQGKPCILVGTQMLAKGHHFPKVTLVCILDMDGGLFASDFRAAEHSAQLIEQVAGRAGRADLPGKVMIPTHHPDHPLLETLLYKGYLAFAERTLAERQMIGLPPYGYLALLRAEATREALPLAFLQQLSEAFSEALPQEMEIWGPVPTLMQRKAGRHRFQIILKSSSRPLLQQQLNRLTAMIEESDLTKKVKWHLDVDPLYLE